MKSTQSPRGTAPWRAVPAIGLLVLLTAAPLGCAVQAPDAKSTDTKPAAETSANVASSNATQPATATASDAGTVDAQAIAALDRMGAYLRSLKSFSVKGASTFDLVSEDGQRVEIPATLEYQVRVPDGLRMHVRSDHKEREVVYDGRTLTVYSPKEKYFATVDAPATLHELVNVAATKYGIELPLADLFLWGTPQAPNSAVTDASAIGPAIIDGVPTQQYAFRQGGTDWQVWIADGAQPVPRRIVITTTTDPARPQYATMLTWNTSAAPAPSTFAFTPPAGAQRIELVQVAAVEEKSP